MLVVAIALLVASGPVDAADADKPPACLAASNAVIGALGGGAAGVVVAAVVANVARATSRCRLPGAQCIDDLDSTTAGFYAGVIAVPIGAALGAGLTGYFTYKSLGVDETKANPPAPLEHAY